MSLGRKMARGQKKRDKMSPTGTHAFMETTTGMVTVGRCTCGKPLYHYLRSEKDNLFNVYCLGDHCETRDARKEYVGIEYFTTPQLRTAKDIILFVQSIHMKKDWTEAELNSIPMKDGE